MKSHRQVKCIVLSLFCCIQLASGVSCVAASQDNDARYNEIRRLIKANRHLSAHMVLAVDARTIKSVRGVITENDIPVLVQMMGDKDYGVASAASGLLVTLGEKARQPLNEATRSENFSVASQARDALMLMENCFAEPDRINPDVCPSYRARKNR